MVTFLEILITFIQTSRDNAHLAGGRPAGKTR